MRETPLTLAAYTLELPGYACARLRLWGPLGVLGARVRVRAGARTDGVNYALSADALQGADVVLFQRYFPMERTWPLVERAVKSGAAVVYDLDDNFLAVPDDHPMAEALAQVRPWAGELLRLADLVTVSTPELARAVAPLCRRVRVLPNLVDPALWRAAPRGRDRSQGGADAVHVVFAGTPSHRADLEALAPALARLGAHFGPRMRLTLMGCDVAGLAARLVPFEPDYAAYARALAGLTPDIGLAPLADTAFNRCKSAVKWLEYSALGAVGVYADLPPYAPVDHGRTGLKAGPDPAGWEEALGRLLEDAALRKKLGRQARAEVFGRHRLDAGAEAWLDAWREAVQAKAGRDDFQEDVQGDGRAAGRTARLAADQAAPYAPEASPKAVARDASSISAMTEASSLSASADAGALSALADAESMSAGAEAIASGADESPLSGKAFETQSRAKPEHDKPRPGTHAKDKPAEFDWAGLPGPLRYGLLLGSTGRPHLAGLARLGLSAPATQELGLSLLRAAWQAAPLDASLAGALDALNRGRGFLPPALAGCVQAVAVHASSPADTGPLAELAARRDHAGLARFLDDRLADRLNDRLDTGSNELFWRSHRLDLAFLLADWDRARALVARPWPPGTELVRAKLAGDLAFQTGDPEAAARFYVEAAPLCAERLACTLVRLGRRQEGAALLAQVASAQPWNTGALLRLHDISYGLDQPGPHPSGPVAICLYTSGKADEFDATLAALAASNLENARVLALDNASPGRTPEVFSAWADRLGERFIPLRLPVNIGAPAARNWLMTRPEVRGSAFTAYLDDDALVPPDWLGRFGAAVAAYPDASVWGCLTADLAAPGRMQNADIHLEWEQSDTPALASLCAQDLDFDQFAYLRPCLSVTGCCHLFRTEALLAGGGFDIRFSPTQYDDLDHDLRLARSGGQAVYQGHLKVLHARLSGALLHLDERATANSQANLRKLAAKHPPDVLETLRRRDEDMMLADLVRKRERVLSLLDMVE